MKRSNVNEYTGGWIAGSFSPAILNTGEFEIGFKKYLRGEINPKHYHVVAVEFTIVLDGVIQMNEDIFYQDDIITVEPNEVINFISLTDSYLCVIKVPSIPGDKYLV